MRGNKGNAIYSLHHVYQIILLGFFKVHVTAVDQHLPINNDIINHTHTCVKPSICLITIPHNINVILLLLIHRLNVILVYVIIKR